MTIDTNFIKKFEGDFNQNVKLSNYSWFNLGGNAEYFYKAKDKKQLIEFLEEVKKKRLKTTFLGAGSNILFRDNGVKGAVIKLGKNFSYTKLIEKDVLDVGAATLDRKVANFAKENNLGNLEFLSCIPGSIGGAIRMNSGCYENDISKVLLSIKAIDINKLSEIEIKKEDIKFSYRGTNLSDNLILISAKIKGRIKKKEEIEKKQAYLIEKKKQTQPSQVKTCGSTFKNIDKDKKAWMLIKEAGCEDYKEGDAMISQKHCNFFVNNGNAKSSDIENLIKKVKKKVYEKTGVNLELEIKIIGE
ncbi:UDP-N-acetylmuramate dehydrogenase [Candidatus Pelagibacter bacterium]|jgi:UDP-N-acetylmuramate dehydrogenase|nr:UDP-N-acetylmuramate dehydrogenase [Candidatus Pelagibacter bacterium]